MDSIDQLLNRRVEKVLPSKDSFEKLLKTKKIRLFQGFDPTASRLHLGHTIGLRKLMEFANLGHEVIFLFGTGTVLVGDPSQRDTGRKLISQKEIDKNITTWKKQVEPIVDFNKIKILQNGDWLTKLKLKDIIKISSNISAIQLFKRDTFKRRIKKGDTVWYFETMYPLLQGYDSVHMDVDLEIGGTDQEFNMLIGRELQRKMNNREKYVLTVPMIAGYDGKQMSKTSGNCVWLDDKPEEMYGKLMRLPDEHIKTYTELLTDLPLKFSDSDLKNKKRLAFDIVKQFNGKNKADAAQAHFESTFQKKQPQYSQTIENKKTLIATISKIAGSNSQAKRLIKQNAVDINNKTINDIQHPTKPGDKIKIGKRGFYEIN